MITKRHLCLLSLSVIIIAGCSVSSPMLGENRSLVKIVLPTMSKQRKQVENERLRPVLAVAKASTTAVPVRAVLANRLPPKPKYASRQRSAIKVATPSKALCRYIIRDLSRPNSKVVYCMPKRAY